MTRLAYWLFALALIAATAASAEPGTIKVIERKPLSRDLFTQGLEFHNGKLYLSSGLYGQSRLLRMDPGDGRVLARQDLDSRLFAEGLTVLHDRIYQLTWRSGFMLVYDKASLAPVAAWPIAGEGWGLTNNGSELIASDGSDKLTFLSASDGRALRRIRVSANGRPVNRLNELEWIDQRIWANVWHTDRIVIIHPDTGHVEAELDLQGLLAPSDRRRNTDVLNGIARDPASDGIWVTGKRWPWMYRIELGKPPDNRPGAISRYTLSPQTARQ